MPGATIERVTVRMDGWPGSPGFMTFYGTDAIVLRPKVIDFINAVKINFPTIVTFTVPTEGEIFNDANGHLEGSWTSGSSFTTTGGTAGAFAAVAGACVAWSTAGVAAGSSGIPRRVRGRTFLVPLHPVVFENDGTITAATLTSLRAAAVALRTGSGLVIWHRPTTVGGSDGASFLVSASNVTDKAAVLRSRRD